MLRVLVTGGSGFIGTNLVEHYRSQGHHVVNVDTEPPRNGAHASLWSEISILDRRSLIAVMKEVSPHLVFHMAARTDLDGQRLEDYAANIVGVKNVISALERLPDLRRVVFASSMLVCRLGYRPRNDDDYNPTTTYGASKVEGERLVQALANNLPWILVRPTSLWGPWFEVPYKRFFDAVRAGWYVHPKGLSVRRSYGFVLNSVAQLECLANADRTQVCGRMFYLADYQPLELRAWAECIRRNFRAPAIKDVPIQVLRWAAKAGDVLGAVGVRNPPLTSFRLSNLTTEAVMDMTPLESICGETPYVTERGVELTIDWINNSRSTERSHDQ